MNKSFTFLAVSALVFGLSATVSAESGEQKTRAQKTAPDAKAEIVSDLHQEIASPVHGAFSVGSQFGMGMRPDVGGFSGNGFLDSSGMPSGSNTPGNPGTYF